MQSPPCTLRFTRDTPHVQPLAKEHMFYYNYPVSPNTTKEVNMSSPGIHEYAAGMRSDAVANATGKDWQEWFVLLDRAGAGSLPQQEIERYLQETEGLSGWWSRMVTVGYEQARGRRISRFRDKSLTIKVARSFETSEESLFRAWADDASRSRWLPGYPILIRKAVPFRTLRINWSDEITGLIVDFSQTSQGTSLMTVRHINLSNARQAESLKFFWEEAMDRLSRLLATH